ncbi:E3 ubiquitin-protein ligase TRIM56-like [Varanus komodoensis]|uniref:E3 ubiquitin-protein ligase TRIM56-like n=1 Tax=Varanus komodoensis TaxID=61221 RepID=UPI001CF79A58|nr:E3 ubiquitin-protein ligase TRIM56-like [Varanus komodoensis]XP_044298951.1 E3 ubiquitin-protein ligase TRIM56-like [Varanus komodoensis]XP_044298958.1 E3 ubiquitin-protein ligase TRIM56-like [Varanus komodoensis]XP_044298965.1 E3 ubiquitin-protein ligase TRIM56-like [Varanus komodoensis]XP_044298972.1 E3 ubiquitin-protein ligase TRIM56-like [Varanus komodoensis]XP_044298981.1 E3 ubiquitin-protein ligase TRIM56-like [Varanus komodoensis]
MATQSSTSLQDLIREDFLTCKICYDLYAVPKILPCLHTYCLGCLEPLVENGALQCPECRLQIEVPEGAAGLKTNFFINGLLELFQMKHKKDLECTVCSNVQKVVAATSRCLDCKDFLCQMCTQGHCCSRLTLHHKVVNLEEFLAGHYDAEVRFLQELCCQSHPQEALRFFCDTCSVPICRDCRMLDHFQHKVVSMASAVQRERPSVEQLIKSLQRIITGISEQEKAMEEAMDKLKADGEHVKEKICRYVEEITTYIFAQKESALAKLHVSLTEQLEGFRIARKELQIQKDKAMSTQQFSQHILGVGKDYEILYLEGMIRNRVEELQAYKLQQFPSPIPELVIAWDNSQQLSEAPLFRFVFPGQQPERDAQCLEPESQVLSSVGEESGEATDTLSDADSCATVSDSSASTGWRIQAEYAFSFGLDPSCSRKKPNITGIAVVPHTGQVLLLDQANDEIKQYSPGGEFQGILLLPDPDSDSLFCGISVCGEILACSSETHLYFLTLDGAFLRKLQMRGSETSYALASYRDSYVAVSEGTLCSISLYNPSGLCVGRVQPESYHGGKFLFIAVNNLEEFVVSDFIKKQIVIMEKSGAVLKVLKPTSSLLTRPFSVCVDEDRNIFVVDQFKVIQFSSDDETGRVVLNDQGQVRRPRVLAIDNGNLILVREDGSTDLYCL